MFYDPLSKLEKVEKYLSPSMLLCLVYLNLNVHWPLLNMFGCSANLNMVGLPQQSSFQVNRVANYCSGSE